MRLVIIDDNALAHGVHDEIDMLNWYDVTEVQELITNIRAGIEEVKAGDEETP